ncbi:MarR family winged helix-turn-helix transcriptional regulator [Microbacterium oleivorans]|uniref:MarR family transcriptional regulator n=1 Tax=Microbacterium oleivorans TaxID=273677 RepID=A0A7D5IY48_9MICO|nr:MarR family transcriptional regulator [Microbacterium oleivorans]QLD10975.1 MarR family transcriptional regulator [Microbacterium oleivorans]
MTRTATRSTTRSTTAAELRYAILAAQREGNRLLAAQLKPLDVTPSQAEVITVLGERGPLTLKGLGELLVCETGSPSRLVDSLVRRGIVDRVDNPTDRREVLLELTADGQKLRPRVAKAEASINDALLDAFGDDGVAAVAAKARDFLAGSNAGAALERRFGGR